MRLVVLADPVVELLRDAGEVRRRDVTEGSQERRVLRRERDVALQLLESGLGGRRVPDWKTVVRQGNPSLSLCSRENYHLDLRGNKARNSRRFGLT
nr:hypothetical protein [Nannocystis poenicansa]